MSGRRCPFAPGPRAWPVIGHAPQLLTRIGDFLLETARRYGPIATVWSGPVRTLIVSDPAAARDVLVERVDHFEKNYGFLRPLLGDGLLTARADERWRFHRRTLAPLFGGDAIARYAPVIRATAAEMLDRWEASARAGRPVEAHADLSDLTLRVIGLTLFETDLAADLMRVREALATITAAFFVRATLPVPLPLWVPTRTHRRLRPALATLREVVDRVIEDRRHAGGQDAVGLLLQARDEHGRPLALQEVRDETATLILAGHETTANVLTWALALLAQHPDEAAAVRERVTAPGARGDAPDAGADAAVRSVLNETMRLYPPVWIMERLATVETVVGGIRVPRGTLADVCPWTLQRNAALWPDPDRFRPSRFDSNGARAIERFATLPFGAGPRQCLGMGLAMVEAQTVLSMILRRFSIRLEPGFVPEPAFTITLRPRHGLRILLDPLP